MAFIVVDAAMDGLAVVAIALLLLLKSPNLLLSLQVVAELSLADAVVAAVHVALT